jgi:periplasmic protein TonB
MIARLPGNSRDRVRWTACFAVALLLHVAGAAALIARWDDSELTANPSVITIDLAPVAAAPEITPADIPIGPQQVETAPQDPAPPPPHDLAIEPPKPPQKPPEKKKVAKLTSAPTPAEQRAPMAVAPMAGAGSHNPDAMPNWKSQLVAQIERHKRYPADARGESGIAQVAFSVDRGGRVHNSRIVRSSGSSVLDHDALTWIERSQPLPPPPADVAGALIPITVPLRYNYR